MVDPTGELKLGLLIIQPKIKVHFYLFKLVARWSVAGTIATYRVSSKKENKQNKSISTATKHQI